MTAHAYYDAADGRRFQMKWNTPDTPAGCAVCGRPPADPDVHLVDTADPSIMRCCSGCIDDNAGRYCRRDADTGQELPEGAPR
jgi:hypothetical protein